MNLEADDAAIDKTVTNIECLSLSYNLEKVFLNQPPLSAKVPHFQSKEVYSPQTSGAFTLFLNSETKNIFSGIDFFFYPLCLIRIYYLEVLQVEVHIKISFDFQKKHLQ